MCRLISFCVFLLVSPNVCAEDGNIFLDDDIDVSAYFADIPPGFDIATADSAEIAALPFFTPAAAQRVIAFRDSPGSGNPLDIPAVRAAFTSRQALVIDYLLRDSPDIASPSVFSLRSGFGYRPGTYEPADGHYYMRLMVEKGMVSGALLGERDPFEPRAFDLLSFSLAMTDPADRWRIHLGDYRPDAGLGLLWSRYTRTFVSGTDMGFSATSRVINTMFEESRYLRGVHASAVFGAFTAAAWMSGRRHVAALSRDGTVLIRETGINITPSDDMKLTEGLAGFDVTYDHDGIASIGVTGALAGYLHDFEQTGVVRKADDDSFSAVSLYGTVRHRDDSFSWEVSVYEDNSHAVLAGFTVDRGSLELSASGRHYSRGYNARHASAMSTFGDVANETGGYTAVAWRPVDAVRTSVSWDVGRTISRTYTVPMPRRRTRLRAAGEVRLPAFHTATVSLRKTADDDGAVRKSVRAAIGTRYRSSQWLEYSLGGAAASAGESWGPFMDGSLRMRRGRMIIDMDTFLFDIPSYDARYYRYVSDVPGRGMSLPYWGRGAAAILMLRYRGFSVRYRVHNSSQMQKTRELTIQTDITW